MPRFFMIFFRDSTAILDYQIHSIKWGKDRGKDVPSAPWFNLGPDYGGKEGDRINDHHLTLEEKQRART